MVKDVIRVVAAVIEDEGRYLLTQRKASAVLPLKWEFPGGRIEDGETESQALAREVRWRLGVDVEIVEKLGEHVHEYEHYEVLMSMFSCRIVEGQTPRSVNVADLRWVASADLGDYEFPPADEGTMDKLLGLMRN